MTSRSFWTSICAIAAKHKMDPVSFVEKAGISKEVYKTWTSKRPADEDVEKVLTEVQKLNPLIIVTKDDILEGMTTIKISESENASKRTSRTSTKEKTPKTAKVILEKVQSRKSDDEKNKTEAIVKEVVMESKNTAEGHTEVETSMPAESEITKSSPKETKTSAGRASKQNASTFQKEIARKTQEFAQQLAEFVRASEDCVELSVREKELIRITRKLQPKDFDMLLTFAKRLT